MKEFFSQFRENIIGINQSVNTCYGPKKILYADWTASGRCYGPIEKRFQEEILPLIGNTHTETSSTGMAMTYAYHHAQQVIKNHVNASKNDALITCNSGMTGVINKLQRILGLKVHENFKDLITRSMNEKPIVFITHMEHHSNHTSWLETIAEVEIINPDSEGLVDLEHFKQLLEKYQDRKLKIAAVTSCSNVTGIRTPYYEIAKLIHQKDGYCFVDFACSAPYVDIDMHPSEPGAHLDAIYFSPHKFLGGPGSSGVLVFNSKLYHNAIPDNPGGGTVTWTNPWGDHSYINDIEQREDGGTPGFLQTMRIAMCMKLKEAMGTNNILQREHELIDLLWNRIAPIKNLHILAGDHKDRLAVISFYINDLHYNLGVKMLNDRFGIQSRGGCSCAGTYGHYLLNIHQERSSEIANKVFQKDYSLKPGWIRVSLHPTMTDEDVIYLGECIAALAENHQKWKQDYEVNVVQGAFKPKNVFQDKRLKQNMEANITQGFSSSDSVCKLFNVEYH